MKPSLKETAVSALKDGFLQIPQIAMTRGGKLRHSVSLAKKLSDRVPQPLPELLQMQRIALDLKTTNTVRHSYGRQTTQGGWAQADFIELARIPSQYGNITTLRQINTWLGSRSGIALSVRSATDLFLTPYFRYYLVYTPVQAREQYAYSAAYAGELKGTIVFEHPPWEDNRYQYGAPDNEITIPLIPHYNCSLFAERLFLPIDFVPEWDVLYEYVRGDLALYDGVVYIAGYNHQAVAGNRPDNDPGLWEAIGDNLQLDVSVYGELEASYQSEQQISAIWQARRTYDT